MIVKIAVYNIKQYQYNIGIKQFRSIFVGCEVKFIKEMGLERHI